jgi:hypothetical protein
MKLTSKFSLNVEGTTPASLRQIRVNVPFFFPDPAVERPAPALITSPVWKRRPSGLNFPESLAAKGVREGRSLVDCRVAADGELTGCSAKTETPEGSGFGQTAVAYVSRMELAPWTPDGRPVEGAELRLPIRVKAPEDTGAAPSSPPAEPRR